MKTIRNTKTGELKRLNDKEAEKLVRQSYLAWSYVPKQAWKETRETKKQNSEPSKEKTNGPKKGKRVSE